MFEMGVEEIVAQVPRLPVATNRAVKNEVGKGSLVQLPLAEMPQDVHLRTLYQPWK